MDKYKLIYEINRAKLTRKELSEKMGISQSALSKKINGKSEFTLGEIQRIVDILGLESPVPIFFANKVS